MRVTLASGGAGHTSSPHGAQGREGKKACQQEPGDTALPGPMWALPPRRMGHCLPGERGTALALWGDRQNTGEDSESGDMKATCASPVASTAPGSPGA